MTSWALMWFRRYIWDKNVRDIWRNIIRCCDLRLYVRVLPFAGSSADLYLPGKSDSVELAVHPHWESANKGEYTFASWLARANGSKRERVASVSGRKDPEILDGYERRFLLSSFVEGAWTGWILRTTIPIVHKQPITSLLFAYTRTFLLSLV